MVEVVVAGKELGMGVVLDGDRPGGWAGMGPGWGEGW